MSALKNAIQDILIKDHRAIENAFTKYRIYFHDEFIIYLS